MNIELLARKALESIKSKWGLPSSGLLAGGSLANLMWELVSGNKAIINDIDIFHYDGKIDKSTNIDKSESLFLFKEHDVKYHEEYQGMGMSISTKDRYVITSAEKNGIFNNVKYVSTDKDPSFVIRSFDINCTAVGYSIEEDRFFWTEEFEDFLKTGNLKVVNATTPSHTAIRIAKKSKELNANLDEFEFRILSHCLKRKYYDIARWRFKDRYCELYEENKDILEKYFYIKRDTEIEQYLMLEKNVETQLFFLECTDFLSESVVEKGWSNEALFEDINVYSLNNSKDFIFYARNVLGNEKMADIWGKVHYYYKHKGYFDIEVEEEDLNLLDRFSRYAPNSIENLKGMKISEQIGLIKKLLETYSEDPIVAITLLEKGKISKDTEFDEYTKLILELSVRREITTDFKGKAFKILNA